MAVTMQERRGGDPDAAGRQEPAARGSPVIDRLRAALGTLERHSLPGPESLPMRPIFIISLPRSGSTIFYLMLLQHFRLAYFSNLMARLPLSPVLVGRLTRAFGGGNPPSALSNYYGTTRGWAAPNQGWQIFNRWLPATQDYIDPTALTSGSVAEMRSTVAGLQRCFGAPFASKWQRHAPRLRALATIFPEALFVHLRRSPVMTAQSILAGRREFLGDEGAWLSARPRNFREIEALPALEQVCAQVSALEADISEDRRLIGDERFFSASYEGFCADPEGVFDALQDWYRARAGQPLAIRRPPEHTLEPRATRKVSDEEAAAIRRILEPLENELEHR